MQDQSAGKSANLNVGQNRVPMGRYVDEHDPSYPLVCALLLGFDTVVRPGSLNCVRSVLLVI